MSSPELFERHPANPILTAEDWPYPVNAVFNPAAALVDGKTVLLARVEDRRGISHLTVARSPNGFGDWSIDPEPLLAPNGVASERWGFEDPRVVWIDELRRWLITCTAYGPAGPAVFLASTEDFASVERHGIIRQPEDKNAALLPDRVDGRWVLLHRPTTQYGGGHGEIALSRSDDMISWSAREMVLQPRAGAWWDSLRIGLGPPPMRTEDGWLLVYHGVKQTVSGDIYRTGLALLDLEQPTRVLRRLSSWVLAPTAQYERTGDVPNVIFPCGLLHDEASDELRLYYGAADSSICLASARLRDVLDALLSEAPAS
jgi:beta-1,4-mannooligosaccharide/beta-1,4-mannosyl-N-acetylglucosamine phosphorylase